MYLPTNLFVSVWLIIGPVAAVGVAAGIVLYVVYGRAKRLDNLILEIENKLGKIKSIPIKEKLAKLEVIGKSNVVFSSVYEEYAALLRESNDYYEQEIVPEIDKAEAELKAKKYEQVQTIINGINGKVEIFLGKINQINQRLDDILKEDVDTRSYENVVRDLFKSYKDIYRGMYDDVALYRQELEAREASIASLFTGYDDNLRTGHFEDAKDELKTIEEKTHEAIDYLNNNRNSIVMVTRELPASLNEIILLFNEMITQGFPLYNLSATTKIAKIKTTIEDLISRLRIFNTTAIEDDIADVQNNIADLKAGLENERESRIEFDEKNDACYDKAAEIERSHAKYMREVAQLSNIYSMDDVLKGKSILVRSEVTKLSVIRKSLDSLTYGNQPYSLRVTKIREMVAQIEAVEKSMTDYKQAIIDMKDIVEYGYKQVSDTTYTLKNAQIQVRNARHEVLRQRYIEDFNYAYKLIETLNELVSTTPIDTASVGKCSAELNVCCEKLLAAVNLDLEQKSMAEQLIMYANSYRSIFNDVARNIGKAEDLYFAGEFKTALTTALQAVERFPLPDAIAQFRVQ